MANSDREPFVKIYDRHFKDVYAYVAFRVAPDREAAQDITQDVFLAGLRTFSQFQGNSAPLTWLRAIARSKVADYFRASVPTRAAGGDSISELAADLGDSRPNREERAFPLSVVMRRLSDKHAELLELKYLEGLSVREVARIQSMSGKAVESALSRARDAFRKAYQGISNEKGVVQ